jgi:hypothetical protein
MRHRFLSSLTAIIAAAAVFGSSARSVAAQGPVTRPPYTPPRTANGQPDVQGVWQVLNSAAWNLEDHPGSTGVPAGQSVVEGGTIPYQPWAFAKRAENFKNRMTADPEAKCHLPGVPRITYMPFPFQIVQFPRYVMINYEYLNTTRLIYLDDTERPEADVIDFFMGASNGHWEGSTLVVDTTNNNDLTWFDRAGNFHSDALHVIERYTPVAADLINYGVTIEDQKVFTRPWTLSMPLYRRQEPNVQVLEYECFAYAEEDAEAAAK